MHSHNALLRRTDLNDGRNCRKAKLQRNEKQSNNNGTDLGPSCQTTFD